jgi:hypothetical protein
MKLVALMMQLAYAANMAELENYQVEYYGQKLSPEELIIKELLENFDVSAW